MGAYTKNVRVVNGGAYTKIVDTPLNLGTGGTINNGATTVSYTHLTLPTIYSV